MEWIKPEIQILNINNTLSGAQGSYDGSYGSDAAS